MLSAYINQVRRIHLPCFRKILLFAIILCSAQGYGYSVLTHEELIDLVWTDSIRPLLLAKFPGATESQLRDAHAFAYGGSAIQDMGYYPFGKEFFSDLTHYVRSGDFVTWLLENARSIDEYAFALGALSHYLGDSLGHAEAINPATAIEFPKLEQKFGPSVTYDESPHGHIRTEFAFDVGELADRDFAPVAYLKHIGFKVPRKFLEQAFLHTYGFDIHDVLGRAHPALRSYRTSVRSLIPAFADAEVVLHRHQFPPHANGEADRIFAERVARTAYDRHWKHAQRGPGFKAHLLAIVVFIVPKLGPASDLAIKVPNADTRESYLHSLNHTVDAFREKIRELGDAGASYKLANIDLDTGDRVKRGDYPMADKTYARLLERLTSRPGRIIPAGVKQNISDYYATVGITEKVDERREAQLTTLRTMRATD
jgi:Zinc dependent phospholipase C